MPDPFRSLFFHPLTSFNLSCGAMPRRVQPMKQSPLHPLLLSAVADSFRRPFPEIRLLPDGAFAARDGRPGTLTGGNLNAWNLSPSGAERVLGQWRRRETPLVIDYEHQSLNARHNGQPAPAAGWIESLRYEPGQGLFASIRWTEGAKAFIGQDEYRFISPVFSFNPQNGDVLELKGAALTSLVRANTALREQLSVALSVTQGDHMARNIEEAVADGRLSRGLVGWAAALGRRDPEALETYLAAVSPIAALSSLQSTGSRPVLSAPAASPLSDEERFVCSQLGLSEAEYLAVRG